MYDGRRPELHLIAKEILGEPLKVIEFAKAERILKIIQEMDDLTSPQHQFVMKKLKELKRDSLRLSAHERRKGLLEIGGIVRFYRLGNRKNNKRT